MYSRVRVAVDRGRFRCDKQLAAVRSKTVAVEFLERAFAGGSGVEQYFYRFARLEGVFDDLRPVCIHLRIVFSVSRNGDNSRNALRSEFSGYDFS